MNKFHWVSELVCKYEIKCTPKQFDETLKIYELADNGYIYISGFDAIHIAHMNGRPVSKGRRINEQKNNDRTGER